MKYYHYLLCLLIPFYTHATELAPWYPRNLEPNFRAVYNYQYFTSVDTASGSEHYNSSNHLLNLGLYGAYEPFSVELETNLGATRHRMFTFSDITLTGRYQFLDDSVGDPLSLVAGLSLQQVFTLARNDISCFYHGGIQAEFDLAAGIETPCWQFWTSRLWAVGGIGFADIGSPWLRFNAAWEHNCWDLHKWGIFMNTLWGLGEHGLHLNEHFHGYGSIRHQSVDIGIGYEKHFCSGASLGIAYAFRPYALNCPRYVNQVYISFNYPFAAADLLVWRAL